MRASSPLPLALLLFVGCEPMPEPGAVFEPVPAASQASAADEPLSAEPAAGAELEEDDFFPAYEPVVIHSSELGQAVPEEDGVAEADPVELAHESEPELQHAPVAAEASPVPQSLPLPVADGFLWPLRVVATVPDAQPPRAILGLPGGKELVVSPGSMIPEAGVVVMAVGSKTVDVAEIRPAGDHAVVQDRTLHALNTQSIEIDAAP